MLHFTCFWLPGCGDFALFLTVPWLAWSPRLSQNTPSTELFSKKNHVLLSKFFSFSNMFFIRLSLANARKKIGCHPACFLTNCRERWTKFSDRSQDREFAQLRLGRDTKKCPSCSKFALDIKLVFSCFYVFDIANT